MEDLTHHADGGGWEKWAAGCLLPISGVMDAVWCLIDKRAVLPGKHGDLVIAGDDAVLFSIAILALAAFLHFHFFWALHERLWRYSQGC